MSDIWLTQTAAQVAVQRALTSVTTTTWRSGTVQVCDYGTFIHQVRLDEPGGSIVVQCHDITQNGVGVGDRVTVVFAPPHQALIIGSAIHDPWHIVGTNGQVPFNAGWGNDGSAVALDAFGYPQVMFRREGTFVHLRGTAAGSSVGNVIFTMPVGYRPRNNLIISSLGALGGHSVIQVNIDGNVVSQAGTSPLFFHDVMYTIL